MILYRGDNFFNEYTDPGRFRTDGIRSKAFGKGDPAYIQREGLIESLLCHINPNHLNPKEKSYYDTTDFISFSESYDRALYWLKDRGKITLERNVIPYTETRYLFSINIDMSKAIKYSEGLYYYEYKCNMTLKTPNAPDFYSILQTQLIINNGCEVCQNQSSIHRLILINSEEYLNTYKSNSKKPKALIFAKKDQEWLLLPFDEIAYGFKHARIPRSDIWSVDLFDSSIEKRDPNYYTFY